MSAPRVAIALAGVAAAIALLVVLVSGTLGKATRSAPASPPCLPATFEHSARLAGVAVSVSPEPESSAANPHTQISFRGVPSAQIRAVSVIGRLSGAHPGALRAYSQGDGASFVPATPFQPGERVSVRATIGRSSTNAKQVAFGFVVDTPYSTAGVPPFSNPKAAAADYESFATLPGLQAPILSVTTADRDPAAGDILTTNGPGAGRYGALIYTPQGRLVWFDQLAGDTGAENLAVQSYNGRRDLTLWRGRVLSLGFGEGEDLVVNDRYQTVARIHGGNGLAADLHDFQIAPHNVAYLTAYNPIRCDLTAAQGAREGTMLDTAVQQIDMKTGLVRWEWHSLDHVAVSESQTTPPKGTPWDWFHLNSLDPQPNGDVFISARSTWAGYQIDGNSGEILWRLGGLASTFEMGPGTRTAWQHDGRILANGDVTFFDNGSNPRVHSQSRAVRIALDFKTHRARLVAVFTHPNPLLSVSQGNVQTLADGNTVVGYGAIPEVSEYAKDGRLLFSAHLPFVMSSYRSVRSPWSGRPLSPPVALATLNNTGEETIVHASWNGASDVATWRVLAGESAASLKAQTVFPASGFESSASLPERFAYVGVQALDAAGRVLGTSAAVRVQ